MSENLKFYKGLEANLPTSGIEVGALYHCTDTGNTYRGVTSTEMQLFSTTNSESDWNANENEIGYVKNRTHWIEDGPGEPIFENISIEANGKWYIYSEDYQNPLTLVQENIYIVVNNIYERIEGRWFEDWTEENQVTPNGNCWTKSLNIYESASGEGNITNNTDQDIVVSIYHAIPIYHKLNKNFLPDNLNIPVKSDEGQASLIGNDLENNSALGAYSIALGQNNIAGGKGYKITYVETVTDEDGNVSVNNIGFEIGSLTEQEFLNTCNWQAKDIFSVSVEGYYQWDFCGTLTGAPSFDGNIVYWSCITTDYGDKKLSDLSDPEFTSTHISTIYVPTKPCGTITVGSHAHAEGYNTVAASRYAHTEGYQNQAGYSAHAEGQSTIAKGLNSHSEGYKTKAMGATSHAEGSQTQATGDISHAEGYKTESSGARSHAEGYQTTAAGKTSHAEGQSTQATGEASHAEGFGSDAIGIYAHAEGYITESSGAYSHAEGQQTTATGEASHAEGYGSDATGTYAHAEGQDTQASGDHSHSEGRLAKATGTESHAEGYNTKAIGSRSHAEGRMTTAQGDCSHSEGSGTLAVGARSHAEGINTIAYSADSHVEGSNTIAGTVDKTAKSQGAHVQGRWNIEDTEEKYAHIVGNGNSANRSNAHTLDWEGNAWFAGNVSVGNSYEIEGWNDNGDSTNVKVYSRLPQIFFGTVNPNEFYDDNGQVDFGQDGDIYIMLSE